MFLTPKIKTMKRISIIQLLSVFLSITGIHRSYAQTSGEIIGYVTDEQKDGLPNAAVQVMSDSIQMAVTITDLNGRYCVKPINSGTYTIKVSYSGHRPVIMKNIEVSPDKATYADIKLSSDTLALKPAIVNGTKPIIDQSPEHKETIDAKLIAKLPTPAGNIKRVVTSFSAQVTEGKNGEVYMRGSRSDATEIIIDGQKVIGSSTIPNLAVATISFYTGGIPAQYGDVTGGLIVVTTKDHMWCMREQRLRYNKLEDQKQENTEEEKNVKKITPDSSQKTN